MAGEWIVYKGSLDLGTNKAGLYIIHSPPPGWFAGGGGMNFGQNMGKKAGDN